jgi:hypothetical protein
MPFDFVIPIGLHTTSDKELWQELIGPVVVALTAIVAAWIAARTANHRQQEQLANDRQLQADQLAHDRQQHNRQHVRDTVDEAVQGVDTALRSMFEYEAKIVVGDTQRVEHREALDDASLTPSQRAAVLQELQREAAEIHAGSNEVYAAATDLTSENLRLSLRLGDQHQLVKAHQAVRDIYASRHYALEPLYKGALSETDRQDIRSASDSMAAIIAAFMAECRTWFAEEL